jgi:hypothetical protein
MARKDIHRPAAIEPADYVFVAFDHLPGSSGDLGEALFMQEQRKYKRAHMARTGGKYSGHEHGGLCHVCGSVNAIYSATFYHEKSNSYIRTGLDCAQKLECAGIDAFKKNVKKAKEAAAGKRKAAAILAEAGLGKAWELYVGDTARDRESTRDENTLFDIVSRLVKWGNISDKALAFLATLLDRIERAPEIAAAKAAAKALELANAKPVPVVEGRVKVMGEVLSLKEQEGFYGIQLKMLVKTEGGFKLWGSVPSAIRSEVERGSVVEFSAALQKSDNDEYFGFFSRPSKAKVIKALAA